MQHYYLPRLQTGEDFIGEVDDVAVPPVKSPATEGYGDQVCRCECSDQARTDDADRRPKNQWLHPIGT